MTKIKPAKFTNIRAAMIKNFFTPIFIGMVFISANCSSSDKSNNKNKANQIIYPSDTLELKLASSPPVIDGKGDDPAWNASKWHPINQVWIPYGEEIDSTIFHGRYKVTWSEEENLLYILTEISDNVFVDGYQYDPDPEKGGGYADHDIFEVFIDENKSGVPHVFNSEGEDPEEWGANAEAAFAYHIVIDKPADGETISEKMALDITGKNWDDYIIIDYEKHLPQFAVYRDGNKYTWEFSLRVHNDTYDHSQSQSSLVNLKEGKVMGFSVAYCNNDDPGEEPKKRDHFFGSVQIPEENYNDHWKNSELFGTIKLVK